MVNLCEFCIHTYITSGSVLAGVGRVMAVGIQREGKNKIRQERSCTAKA